MPDLQTALTNAITKQVLSTTINEWEEEEKQTMQAATQPQAPIMQTQTQINGNSKLTLTGKTWKFSNFLALSLTIRSKKSLDTNTNIRLQERIKRLVVST